MGLTLPRHRTRLPKAAFLARVMRSALLDVLGERLHGAPPAPRADRTGQGAGRHGLRNALIPGG